MFTKLVCIIIIIEFSCNIAAQEYSYPISYIANKVQYDDDSYTASFYKITKENRAGWLDIKTFKTYN